MLILNKKNIKLSKFWEILGKYKKNVTELFVKTKSEYV